MYLGLEEIASDSRRGESFEGGVLNSTLTEKLGTRNNEDEAIYSRPTNSLARWFLWPDLAYPYIPTHIPNAKHSANKCDPP